MTSRLLAVLNRVSRPLLAALVTLDVALGVVLRFKTTSKLWLDEAQSVNIASRPLSELVGYLRQDGAPPLYYVCLHVWMGIVGHSDFDVRALSGVFSVLALGAAYFALRRWCDGSVALVALAVLAVLPYAIYFGTETRMYSLVMLFSALLLWVLREHLDGPRASTTAAIVVIGAALLYTHYWSIYLLGVVFIYGVVRWYRHRRETGRRDGLLVGAVVGAFVLWSPWLAIFNEQRLHTGTPWSPPPTYYQLFTWFDGFTVNQSVPHVVSSLHTEVTIVLFVALVLLGVFGSRMIAGSSTMSMDFLGSPSTRTISFIVLGTMCAGLVASHIDGSAYVPRYAAVIAVPVTYLAAQGISNFGTSLRVLIVLGLLSGACLWTDKWGVGVQRSQAGEIAAVLATVPAGSLVFVCPDQLGPSLLRYSNPSLDYLGYPRFVSPAIVDWYDYEKAYRAHTPAENAEREAAIVAPHQRVFIVRAINYGLKKTCWYFAEHLAQDLGRTSVSLVKQDTGGYYQPMMMQELVPTTAQG